MDRICRLCQGKNGKLISPCNCEGSMGYAHPNCLVEWVCKKKSLQCEICKVNYLLYRATKHTEPPVFSVEGMLLIFKAFFKGLYQRVIDGFPFLLEFFLLPLFNGLFCSYSLIYFSVSAHIILSNYFFIFGLGYTLTKFAKYFRNTFQQWVQWRDTLEGRIADPPILEELLADDEQDDNGGTPFLIPASEEEKQLVIISEFDKRAILSYFSSQLRTHSKKSVIKQACSSVILTEVFLLGVLTLVLFCYLVSQLTILFLIVLLPNVMQTSKKFFWFDSLREVYVAIYSSGSFFLTSIIFYALLAPLLLSCILFVVKPFGFRNVDNLLIFAKGVSMVLFLTLLILLTLGCLSIFLHSSTILSIGVSKSTSWDDLLRREVIPILCNADRPDVLKKGQDLKVILSFFTQHSNDILNERSANFFDNETCPSLNSLQSKSVQWYLILLILLSRIDFWAVFLLSKACFTPSIIIWIHLVYSKILWTGLSDISINRIFTIVNSISLKGCILSYFKCILAFIFVDRTIGVMCFRIASLMVPADLQVDVDGFSFSEPFGMLVTIMHSQYYLTVKETHKTIHRQLMNLFSIYEDIEGNLIGSPFSKICFIFILFMCVLFFIAISTVRFYVVVRSPFQLDLLLHFVVLGQYMVNNGFPFHVFFVGARKLLHFVKLKLCQLVLLGKYGISTKRFQRNDEVGFMCLRCSFNSSIEELDCWSSEELLQLEGCLFPLFLPEHKAFIVLEKYLMHYFRCGVQVIFVFLLLLIPFSFPLYISFPIQGNFFCYQISPTTQILFIYGMNCILILFCIKLEIFISSFRLTSSPTTYLLELFFLFFRPSFSRFKTVLSFFFTRYLLIRCFSALYFPSRTVQLRMTDTVIHLTLIGFLLYNYRKRIGIHILYSVPSTRKNEPRKRAKNDAKSVSPLNRDVFGVLHPFYSWFFLLQQRTKKKLQQLISSESNSAVYFSQNE